MPPKSPVPPVEASSLAPTMVVPPADVSLASSIPPEEPPIAAAAPVAESVIPVDQIDELTPSSGPEVPPVPNQIETGSMVGTPTVIDDHSMQRVEGNGVLEKPMPSGGPEVSPIPNQIEARFMVGIPVVIDDQSKRTVDGNGVLEKRMPSSGPEVPLVPVQIKIGSTAGTPIVIDDQSGHMAEANVVQEKPTRRFTRSLLKARVEDPPPTSEVLPEVSAGYDGLEETIADGSNVGNGPSESLGTPSNMELKMSKKIALTKFPSNIKGLLATGLLEGLSIKYTIRNSDKQEGLRGLIKDGRIICFCTLCKGSKAVSAYQFERHAGSTKKHPPDFIYLENGNTFRDVLRACANAPLDMLESTIQNTISSVRSKNGSTCHNCKESFAESHSRKLSTCDPCLVAKLSSTSPSPSHETVSGARLSKSALALDSSVSTLKIISSQKKNSHGRMTSKDQRLHKLVFMDDILPYGTEVAYYVRGQRLLEGYIKGFGIFCRCCNSVISPSQFEAHAGWASRRKPYLNIYTSNGVSLHELSISLSKVRKFSASENDDLCRICADGGDLLCCDICPRAFHKECVGLTSIPKGDWYCSYCQNMHQKDKAVKHNINAIAAGRVSGVDPIEQIFKRCIRVVKTPETDIGGCVLCRCHDFSKTGFGRRTVLLCDQCEREFHVGCLKDHNMGDLQELPEGKWFCSSDCSSIHNALHELLLSGPEQLPVLQSDMIRKKHEEKGFSKDADLDVRWRLLSGKTASSDSRLLLSKAVSIFHESFDPIIDLTTGKDLIPSMVYGRDMRDQEFGGMYCAVLSVNSSVVSVGIVRVLGCEVAEIPLVATSRDCQGQGYFQSLFSCIERMLDTLKVKHLILPAADEAESIWTKKFGFSKITLDQLNEYAKGSRTTTFQGTSLLHKLVTKSLISGVQNEGS